MSNFRTMRVGDLEPAFNPILVDATTGAAVNLSTAVSIKVSGAQNGNVLFANRAATGSVQGQVFMAWSPGDTDSAGAIALQVDVEWTTGRVQGFPSSGFYMVQVNADLGSGPANTV